MGGTRIEVRRRWVGRLGRYASGGLTVAEFCRREGVSTASFYLWRRRLRDAPAAAEASDIVFQNAAAPRFLPVVLADASSRTSPLATGFGPAALELELPNQVRLRIAHTVEARFVGELLIGVAGLGPRGLTCDTDSVEAR